MIAGRLNKPIVIIHPSETVTTDLGEERGIKKENISTRADVKWGSGRRETANLELVYSYDVTFIVWIYLQDKVKEGDIVRYHGKEYMITSMEAEPETKILYLRCETR